jgi:hypothetical protein
VYANVEQATQGLRYGGRPHGKIQDQRTVARNTKLIRFDDELIGLKLHDTVIATYHRVGVRFDLRGDDSLDGEGWFTDVTLRRLDEFTPARVLRSNGLTYIVANPDYGSGAWTKEAQLYAHGAYVSSEKGTYENGLAPAVEKAIVRTHERWPRMAKNYAKRVVTAWRRFELHPTRDCCGEPLEHDEVEPHRISHIQRNEVVIPPQMTELAQRAKAMGLWGEPMADAIAQSLYSEIFQPLRRPAVKLIEPNFPYPQRQTDRSR